MRWIFLLLAAHAASPVDLSEANYALRLAPRYLKGETPGNPRLPCLVTTEMAQSLSRAQDGLRLREFFVRVHQCGLDYVDVTLEDRSGLTPSTGAQDLRAALLKEGWTQDATRPQRYLR